MQAAKDAVSKFTSRHGHRTDVDEVVAPSVTQETVKPHRHEETTQAVDREVHQDHYHTTVQPISHQERLPEKHSHQALPVQHREIQHENHDHTKAAVAADLGKFQNTSKTHETTHTQQAAPAVTGEHVHHHVHETVVPVIQKETIQPEVVHTTQPIHETHHASSQHHGISALPMKSLDEFKRGGGVIDGGKQHSHEQYDGAPRPYNDKMSTTFEKLGFGHGNNEHGHTHTNQPGVANTHNGNNHNSALGTGAGVGAGAGAVGAGLNSQHHNQQQTQPHRRRRGSNSSVSSSDYEYAADGQKVKKPGLKERLNPRVDADGDGKKGIFS